MYRQTITEASTPTATLNPPPSAAPSAAESTGQVETFRARERERESMEAKDGGMAPPTLAIGFGGRNEIMAAAHRDLLLLKRAHSAQTAEAKAKASDGG